jgi:uncharacterized glyoxalase superfamily metalloenzyme YdcJ
MRLSDFISPDVIRTAFSAAISAMYRTEVPLYGDLIEIVRDVNAAALAESRDMAAFVDEVGELEHLQAERHGAIRVGTSEELSILRRIFAVMGMRPVGYYDLSIAGVPVHSTVFRPAGLKPLQANPFRVFTSLLRLDLIADIKLRQEAAAILAARKIVSDRALDLLVTAERDAGLNHDDADEFIRETLEIFRWHGDASVTLDIYQRLNDAHRLIADVVSFKGPHINHLTPRTLDIDAAHAQMSRRGIDAKAIIEGPPRRHIPILLRQTSFKALAEKIRFVGQSSGDMATHTARFGEIEQRGAALTRAGRQLYDECLAEAGSGPGAPGADHEACLTKAFGRFPDDLVQLRAQALAFFRYEVTEAGRAAVDTGDVVGVDFENCILAGWVSVRTILYEDFLPVSAAGIFQSNLGRSEQAAYAGQSSLEEFEQALGERVFDPFELYEAEERESIGAVMKALDPRIGGFPQV